MQSLKFLAPWEISLQNSPRPVLRGPTDVIVDVAYTGICGTDLGIITGDYGAAVPGVTIGHESSGLVAQVGAQVVGLAVGDRVVINPTYHCGQCRMCRTLRINHCEEKATTEAGVSYDGTFAGSYLTQQEFLLKLPDHLSLQEAAMTEPLSCVVTGLRKIPQIVAYERCVVIGAGPMGLLYTWALTLRGQVPVVVEASLGRRQVAAQALPPGVLLFASLEEAWDKYPDGKLDLVIDTTSGLLQDVLPHLAPGGMSLSIGLKSKPQTIDSLLIADLSLNIVGSIDSQVRSFDEAFALISGGQIPVKRFISHELPLAEYRSALALLGLDLGAKTYFPVVQPVAKVLLCIGGG